MKTQHKLFKDIYLELYQRGNEVSPRGLKILELENYNYKIPPYVRFINFKSRNLNIQYIKREFLWYLKGDKSDVSIAEHAKMWKLLINPDNTINSNYGRYIFGEMLQFDNIVSTLKKDKESRRASIVILNNEHLQSSTYDVPCTYSINFRIRKNKLNMTVRMRSQDAILGMGNDVPAFSFIHEMMLCSLQEIYPDLKYGEYYHSADSFHVYEKHFGMLEKIISSDSFTNLDCPKISGASEVRFLRSLKYDNIPSTFLFTKWLTS